jgi:dTDP-4-dehydrorhamnose 3,5-epimerase
MIITATEIPDVTIITLDPHFDHRGFFARAYCREEFLDAGMIPPLEQTNISHNYNPGVVRGMHFQTSVAPEAKLVRCIRGAMFDVVVDVRPQSETYLRHVSVELTQENRHAIYVPPLFAHGYQTLSSHTEVLYQVSHSYDVDNQRGLRFDDPALSIDWPLRVSDISDRDRSWPLLITQQLHGHRPI